MSAKRDSALLCSSTKRIKKQEYGYSLVSEHRRTLDFYRTETETENLET